MTSGSFLPHEGSSLNHPGSPPTKRDLKSWWKSFKLPKHQEVTTGIFSHILPRFRTNRQSQLHPNSRDENQPSPALGVSSSYSSTSQKSQHTPQFGPLVWRSTLPEAYPEARPGSQKPVTRNAQALATYPQRRSSEIGTYSSIYAAPPPELVDSTPRRFWNQDRVASGRAHPPSQSTRDYNTKQTTVIPTRPSGIFGVPLRESIKYANVAISLVDENNRSYIYGYVPIVVAKCGVFLKDRATGVEGIFRLSGSEKRIKELKTIFDSPDRYGKGLVWEGYTVHDAANVLRRYLNDLPEPVVPLDVYEKFRHPLKGVVMRAPEHNEGNHVLKNMNPMQVIPRYQSLITELPPLNRQLLLYLLDLLAVFAAKADENRMNSQNLAAIFQPGMLSHPSHDMLPEEYRLNQSVIIFLIENQDHFLIGMQGTEADEKMLKAVEGGVPQRIEIVGVGSPLASGLARSPSNASAGAESVRRDGQLRRNRSVSSRNSRQEGGTRTPRTTAATTTPSNGSGLSRSNTVPSKKSPALNSGRFQRESPRETTSTLGVISDDVVAGEESLSPNSARPTRLRLKATPNSVETPSPLSGSVSNATSPTDAFSDHSQEQLLEPTTPSRSRPPPMLAADSPDRRPLNKLRKKRVPGGTNPSAQSSTTSLPHSASASPTCEIANPMDSLVMETGATSEQVSNTQVLEHVQPHQQLQAMPQQVAAQHEIEQHEQMPVQTQTQQVTAPPAPDASKLTPRASHVPAELNAHLQPELETHLQPPPMSLSQHQTHPYQQLSQPHSEASSSSGLLKTKKSPPTSLHSSFNEGSDIDQIDDASQYSSTSATHGAANEPDKEKKRRWRLSRRKEDMQGIMAPLTSPRLVLGHNSNADVSSTSIGSSLLRGPKSNTSAHDSHDSHSTYEMAAGGGGSIDERGSMGWIKNKYREAREIVDQKIADQRRAKSPPPTETHFSFNAGLTAGSHSRGRSFELVRPDQSHGNMRDHSTTSSKHSYNHMPAQQVQQLEGPASHAGNTVIAAKPKNEDFAISVEPVLQRPPMPGRVSTEGVKPALPPRKSHEDHKVPVGPRKPVPGQISVGTASPSVSSTPVPESPVTQVPNVEPEVSSTPEPVSAPVVAPAPVSVSVPVAVPMSTPMSAATSTIIPVPAEKAAPDGVVAAPVAMKAAETVVDQGADKEKQKEKEAEKTKEKSSLPEKRRSEARVSVAERLQFLEGLATRPTPSPLHSPTMTFKAVPSRTSSIRTTSASSVRTSTSSARVPVPSRTASVKVVGAVEGDSATAASSKPNVSA